MNNWPSRRGAAQFGGTRLSFLATVFFLAVVLVFAARPAQTQTDQKGEKEPDRNFWKLPATVQAMPPAKGTRDVIEARSQAFPQAGPNLYCAVLAEFTTPAAREGLKGPGITVYSAFQQFADIFIPGIRQGDNVSCDEGALKAIFTSPGFLDAIHGLVAEVEPPPSLTRGPATRGTPEEIVRGGIAGLKGKGVIIAVFDSGVDFRNPDFISYDASGRPTSRLLYLWDTTSNAYDTQKLGGKAPISYPNGASLGTLYTREQLTAELRSAAARIPATDENGHGTGVAGVAAGNGNNAKGKGSQYVGVAPEADIIAVRLGGIHGSGNNENAYLLNAAAGWVDQVARSADKPAVINVSFGGGYGSHDGNLVTERQLNARFADTVRGRAIIISAGNEQGKGYHARKKLGDRGHATPLVWGAGEKGGVLALYVRNADGTPFDGQNLVIEGGRTADGKPLDLSKRSAQSARFTNDHVTAMAVPGGWSGMLLWNNAGKEAYVDAYVYGGGFQYVDQAPGNTVATPGMARQAITAGSYDWNDVFDYGGEKLTVSAICGGLMHIGELSCYSSVGPGRDPNMIKPDIVAPGQFYSSSYAKTPDGKGVAPPGHGWTVETSGNYALFNGTSAAAPYTTGIVALMLEKKPTLTVGEIHTLLHKYATQDAFTGQTPNPTWGYGKLDMAAVKAILNRL